ncbi:hypothetical protein DBR40_23560 [Pedobacter sp. KBW01]|uniref:hypothetical protein n=1 Tax=Pedobacter sp. KBW01 TaxID=2153364 RepID=UPI000F59A596|nr:hypothetical protein [Pedobacter sp. KBW01]RQO65480.1 hypothetical protein DBR40_23560 [Pedobacter sp. KBW01]
MNPSYFRARKPFSLSPHRYDLGTFIGLSQSHDDNHFLLKIYRIEEKEFADYYSYHLNYAMENNLINQEEFFRHVWQIVQIRIKHFEIQNPFSNNHGIHKESLKRLQRFEKYLKSIDIWNARPSSMVIEEKDITIQKQKEIIEGLQARLDELKIYEVSQKIRIDEGRLPTFIDIIQQLRELQLPSGRKLLKSDHKIPYAKMIAKYFSHGGKDIPIETARNYFVDKTDDIPIKGTLIQPENRLFKIVPINPAKK